jgi:hypothetical protein
MESIEDDASNKSRLFWLHYSGFQELGEDTQTHTTSDPINL